MYVLLNHSEKIRTRREVLEMQKALRPAYIIYWLQLHEELESHDNVGMTVIPVVSLKPLYADLGYGWRKIGIFISELKEGTDYLFQAVVGAAWVSPGFCAG